jgi:hypothetical protein
MYCVERPEPLAGDECRGRIEEVVVQRDLVDAFQWRRA